MANKSSASLIQHLGGVGVILKERGAAKLRPSTSRRTFYEYRAIEFPFDLVMRRSSFLSLPEWINSPWKLLEPHGATQSQTSIDIGFRIPVLMESFDRVRHATQVSWDTRSINILRKLILKALEL